MLIDTDPYDFIDFGCSTGGSMQLAVSRLGGVRGIGIDRCEAQCLRAKKAGHVVVCADALDVEFPRKSVKFSMFVHFLEHLPGLKETNELLRNAAEASTDFLFIEGPSFDYDTYLKNRGFKFFWHDGCGHTNRLQLFMLKKAVENIKPVSFTVMLEHPPITSSASRDIHPLSSPKNVIYYDKNVHPQKVIRSFDKPLFRSFVMIAWLRTPSTSLYTKITTSRHKFRVALNKKVV